MRAAPLASPDHLETSPAIAPVPDSPYWPQSLISDCPSFHCCPACNCSGLSTTCDSTTGACSSCTLNTQGDHCESCLFGYSSNHNGLGCVAAAETSISGLVEWLPFVFYAVIAAMTIVVYIIARRASLQAKNYLILAFGISVIELITDCFFLYQTYSLPSK